MKFKWLLIIALILLLSHIQRFGTQEQRLHVLVQKFMDVITLGDFAISAYEERTVFTFRMPSQGRIDFLPLEQRHLNERPKYTTVEVMHIVGPFYGNLVFGV